VRSISPEFFRLLNAPLLSGRELTHADGPETPMVVIVNESFVKRFLEGRTPIGQRIRIGKDEAESPWWQIAGVVADMRNSMYDPAGVPGVYRSYRQAPPRQMGFLIRTASASEHVAAAARAQFQAVDPQQPLFGIKMLTKMISEERTGFSYVAAMMGIMGLMAITLSAVGIYGLIAYSVSERTHEIGIRIAVGAQTRDVVLMILGSGWRLTAIGLAAGLVLAFGFARGLAALFFGVQPEDPIVYAGVAAIVCVVALAACVTPARRAARLEPVVALRHE
jgi:putative ABC transport system permease protein